MSTEELGQNELQRAREILGSAEVAGRLGITENALDAMINGKRAVLEAHWVAAKELLDASIPDDGEEELNPGRGDVDLDANTGISDTETAQEGLPPQKALESPGSRRASGTPPSEELKPTRPDVRGTADDQLSAHGTRAEAEPDAQRKSGEYEALRRQQMQRELMRRQKLYEETQRVLSNVCSTVRGVKLSPKGRRELLRLGALLKLMIFDMKDRPPIGTSDGMALLWQIEWNSNLRKFRLANDAVINAEKPLFRSPRDIPISAEIFAEFVSHCRLDLDILTPSNLEQTRQRYLHPRALSSM